MTKKFCKFFVCWIVCNNSKVKWDSVVIKRNSSYITTVTLCLLQISVLSCLPSIFHLKFPPTLIYLYTWFYIIFSPYFWGKEKKLYKQSFDKIKEMKNRQKLRNSGISWNWIYFFFVKGFVKYFLFFLKMLGWWTCIGVYWL